ncbi:MAG: gliding motility-associated C-terminal domain-containing protein, partial [Flavobacteriales bacterium]
LTYTIDGTCPATGTATFTVTPNTSSAFSLIPEYCLDHNPATAVADEAGGDWFASCVNCISTAGQFSPAAAGTGVHTITYTIPGSCGTTTNATVTVHALPDADFTYAPAEGCAPAVIECSAPVNPSIVDCQWTYNANGVGGSMGCEENLFVIENPGCYLMSHTVLDNNGCTNTASAEELLCLGAPPSSAFNLSPAQASIFDTNIEAWASDSIQTNTYTWHVDETTMGQGTYHSFSIPEIGLDLFQLCLEAEDSLGCSSLTCAVIDLAEGLNAFAPNAFTPDNDGHNDAWRMYTSGAVTRFELHIYDRWGSLVFTSEDPEEHWVGDVQGGDHFAPDGVYHYEAVLRDDAYAIKTLQGHILLIR